MTDYSSNLEWFYHHCTQFHCILETDVPVYDVAKCIIINKVLSKLPLLLLCTIMIDDGLVDCRVLPQQCYKRGDWAGHPCGCPAPLVLI